MSRFSVHETYGGKHILVTGASGFLGKVWLAMALARVPDIGRIYVLLRGKGRSAKERFEKIVGTSMAMAPLHELHGAEMSEFVSRRVEVIEGDVSQPDLGIDPEIAPRLHRDIDLVINFAGLVDFNPDIREAISSNVDGTLHVADFVERCRGAALLHVSTCYVAGTREGEIEERVRTDVTPIGRSFNGQKEYERAQEIIEHTKEKIDDPKTVSALRDEVVGRLRERGSEPNDKKVDEMVGRLKRKQLRGEMALAGSHRARVLGWTNTYTYSKALAEALLCDRADRLRMTIFRPAIVESALEFPFSGWNEGFNTSGPLVYLAQTWFRHVPACPGNPLDVIPVDLVCNALFTVGAALLRNEHSPVYQVGSSDRNFLAIDRLVELSALGHRRHLRDTGDSKLEKLLLSRWDARASDPEHVLNMTNIRRAFGQVIRYLRHGLPEKIPSEVREWADDFAETGEGVHKKLRQVEEILDLFLPFTHDHFFVFRTREIEKHEIVEPEFRFDPESIEWRSYWLDVHMPGLRRWCFPQYENKEREQYSPATPFKLIDQRPAKPRKIAASAPAPASQEVG